jgi:hypothetical protein
MEIKQGWPATMAHYRTLASKAKSATDPTQRFVRVAAEDLDYLVELAQLALILGDARRVVP